MLSIMLVVVFGGIASRCHCRAANRLLPCFMYYFSFVIGIVMHSEVVMGLFQLCRRSLFTHVVVMWCARSRLIAI